MRFFLIWVILWGGEAWAAEGQAPGSIVSRDDTIASAVLARVEKVVTASRVPSPIVTGVQTFYKARFGKSMWLEGDRPGPNAAQLLLTLASAAAFGLDPADYGTGRIIDPAYKVGISVEDLAQAEVDLSITAVTYATHAQAGRFKPQDLGVDAIDPSPEVPAPQTVLEGIASHSGDVKTYLESFNPPYEQFLRLKLKLAEGDAGLSQAPSVVIPLFGPMLAEGDDHPDVALLRARLKVPKPENAPGTYYDASLAAAVKAFQTANGLNPDGVTGPGTRGAMELPAPVSRKMLVANMERWRWLPRSLGAAYVYINLPEYMVRLVRDGAVVFEERLVVGAPGHETPIFSENMQAVVFNPYWLVPQSIADKEILPIARRNPGYIQSYGLEAVHNGRIVNPYAFNWGGITADDVDLRQLPGPGNALGALKFLFPNKHSVYIHDTPSKSLFDEKYRAFSHGCMRVRNPRLLAQTVLGWKPEDVERLIESGKPNVEIEVKPSIPVHIAYFTAVIDDAGELHVFRDVYGHDTKVIAALKL